jgi:Tol biopolymer transport system component
MKPEERPDLASCPLSIHCLRLLDDLVSSEEPSWSVLAPTEDPGEARLLTRLRNHLPACQICQDVVEQARQERDRQHTLLREMLKEAEQRVPSTLDLILNQVRAGQFVDLSHPTASNNHHSDRHHRRFSLNAIHTIHSLPEFSSRSGRGGKGHTARSRISEVLTLVAVIFLVVLATGVSGYLLISNHHGTTPASRPATSTHGGTDSDWNAVMILTPASNGTEQRTLYNYDPASGQKRLLPVSCCDSHSGIDSISHSGRDLLYHQTIGTITTYSTLSSSTPLFTCQCTSGASAIWTTDDRHILIDTTREIAQVDLQGTSTIISGSPYLASSSLEFYYNDFLFFSRLETTGSVLYRLDLASGETRRIAISTLRTEATFGPSSQSAPQPNWLLSPSGSRIYYASATGNNALSMIYMARSDGSAVQPLNRNGLPLGFAQDNSLIFLQPLNGHFAVKKLAATPQQDQLVLENAAPGASTILSGGMALAPYGEALITVAIYPDLSVKVWASNLTTGTQKVILSLPSTRSSTPPQLVGWDRLPVAQTVTATTPTPQVFPSGESSWNNLLLTVENATGQISISNYHDASGELQSLISGLPSTTQIDGVSPDGKTLAYHIPNNDHTIYYLLALSGAQGIPQMLYSASGNAGNAIWDSNRTLLINTPRGVVEVNSGSSTQRMLFPQLPDARLAFYYDTYLYFVGKVHTPDEALYRIQIGHTTPQEVTPLTPGSSFWLSPDGRTIYYLNHGSGPAGIYATDSDGQNLHRLRPVGVPIGYAEDNSLITLRYTGRSFEVVQLGLTPAQDRLLLPEVAPSAVSLCATASKPEPGEICDNSVALAPYGHLLAVEASYADGSYQLLTYNLDNGQQISSQRIPASQLIGYDTASLPSAAS